MRAARQRAATYEEERQALQQRNRRLMAIELQTTGRHPAVVLGDSRAVAAWREAYGVSMRSGQWRDLVGVGDAAPDSDPDSQERLQAFIQRFSVVAGTH